MEIISNRNNNNSRKQRNTGIVNPTGRLQPQDIELEGSILGGLMLEQDAYPIVSEILKVESFYEPKHRKIYEAIVQLAIQMSPIDMRTVVEQLKRSGDFEEIGGAYYIAHLTSSVLSAAHIEEHARIIAQKYLARELISFSTNIQTLAYDETNDIDKLMQEAEASLFALSQNNLRKEVMPMGEIIDEAIRNIEAAANRKDGLSGLETGFKGLDKMTSGWQRSDLVIIAARPAMGKTAFVLSMAKNMAMDYNQPTAVFSLEMANVQLVNRLIANVCDIPSEKIKNGRLSNDEWERLNFRIKKMQDAPIYIDDTASLSVFELRTKARRLVKEHGVQCIIIDYLQLMNASGTKFGNREQEVSIISRSLKGLAKELNIPIIALSQLNRNVESRVSSGKDDAGESKRPQLSDLRESGSIEQDADMVCFIHRPEYYKIFQDSKGNDLRGMAEIVIAKHRNGAVGEVLLRFRGEFTRFSNPEDDTQQIQAPGGSPQEVKVIKSGMNSLPTTSNGAFTPIADNSFLMHEDDAPPF